MFSEHNEGNRHVSNRNGCKIACKVLKRAKAFKSLDKGEFRKPSHVLKKVKINNLKRVNAGKIANHGKDCRNRIARADTDNKRYHFSHFFAVNRADNNRCQRNQPAKHSYIWACNRHEGRYALDSAVNDGWRKNLLCNAAFK